MSVTWRLLVGSTNQFALDVSLISDPEEPLSDDVIAPSWGEFSLFVEGRNLCEARDPPSVLINQQSPLTQRPWARATTLAHELCHLLYDRRVGRALGVTSGPWAPTRFEQRANAFAAMFLMPEPAAVDRFLATSGAPYDRVRSLAQHYGMSYQATVLHLFNLDVIEPHERDSLLDAVYDPPTES